ncbi:hypothetical protein ACHQM5_019842 [Ranunculus cassubicifolius]
MTSLLSGATVAAAALGGKYLIRSFAGAFSGPGIRTFYKGGFEAVMTKREAADAEKVKQAYKKVMMGNHPDAGGSPFIARKVNEARDLLMKQNKHEIG